MILYLFQFSAVTDHMSRIVNFGSKTTNAAKLQRYREVHVEYRTEYRKLQVTRLLSADGWTSCDHGFILICYAFYVCFLFTKAAISRKRESADLFRGYRGGDSAGRQHASDKDHLLRERNAVHNSTRAADDVLGYVQ